MSEGGSPRALGLRAGNAWARSAAQKRVAEVVEKGTIPEEVKASGLDALAREHLAGLTDPDATKEFWQGFSEGAEVYLAALSAINIVAERD